MRIMTANIWGDYFNNPVSVREENVFKVYEKYAPDVIGMQEITEGWYKSNLFKKLSEKYNFVGTELFNNDNYVPMAISKKYTVLAKGYEPLKNTPDDSKAITWAVLKDENSKVFGAVNTHFWWMQAKKEYDLMRGENAQQLSDIMKYISYRFSCPVFAFGDMNCTRASQAFGVVYAINGVKHLSDMTDNKDTVCSIHGNPVEDEKGFYHGEKTTLDEKATIDHILFIGEGFKVLQYRIVEDQFALDATDHSPVFADIELL